MVPGADPRSAQPAPFRPKSDIGLYLSIVGFLLFTVAGILSFLLLERPWESEEPVVVAPPPAPDAGPPPEPDAGPPAPEVTTYRASLSETATLPFGGPPYCSYEAQFTQLEIEVVTTGTDAQGRPVATGGRAAGTYTERATSRCPHPTVEPNQHELAFASAAYDGDAIVIQFAPQSGAPPVAATFRGTFTDGTLDGTLTLRRNEQVHPLLIFEFQAQMLLQRAPG